MAAGPGGAYSGGFGGQTVSSGAGAAFSIAAGAGGANAGSNNTDTKNAGAGGALSLSAGAGGAYTGSATGTRNGGNGGNVTITPGAGGASAGTPGLPGAIVLAGFEESTGTKPTISGACGANTQTGGIMAGTFTSQTTGACAVTLTWLTAAPTGFVCMAIDVTTSADYIFDQTGGSTTTATFSSTTVTGDVIRWFCRAY